MVDISRMPVIAISRVRGIGVADIDSTSTAARSIFMASLCSTPKRCSSSTITRPRSLILTPGCSSRWVPMTMSIEPSASPARVSLDSFSVWNRDSGFIVDRELPEPLGERRVVLLHQQGRRDEQDDLLAVLDRLERRAHRDLGLAVADVAAHQAVHRDGALHVALDLVDRDHLVGRLDERERVLELGLPRGVGAEGVALGRLPGGVQLDQLAGDLPDGLAGLVLAVGPVGAAEPVERRRLAADVAADLVELVHRHEQPVGGLAALGRGVLDHEVLAGRTLHDALHQLDVATDTVLLVDDEVAGLELERVDLLAAAGRHLALGAIRGALADQVVVRHDGQLQRRRDEAVLELAEADLHDPGDGRGDLVVERGRRRRCRLSHSTVRCAWPCAGRDEHDPHVGGDPALDVGQRGGGVAAVGRGGLHVDRPRASRPGRGRTGTARTRCARGPGSRGGRRRARGTPPSRDRSATRRRRRQQPTTPGGTPRSSRPGRRRGPGCARGPSAGSPNVGGSRSTNDSMSSVRTGVSDSMPSTAWPSAILVKISARRGCSTASSAALARTSSVSSSSRHGGAQTWVTSSRVRWSATAKRRISSTSSPKNSIRSGCSSVGGKTSMMPPRTANSPRRSTRSTRE